MASATAKSAVFFSLANVNTAYGRHERLSAEPLSSQGLYISVILTGQEIKYRKVVGLADVPLLVFTNITNSRWTGDKELIPATSLTATELLSMAPMMSGPASLLHGTDLRVAAASRITTTDATTTNDYFVQHLYLEDIVYGDNYPILFLSQNT
ncbi:hypothetical protein F4814DRAFT_248335 [Daldinia grandis]|nr:hypothetical protein F4814DRAFT_248335 [Daldinia grandis]